MDDLLKEWTTAVKADLGIDLKVDRPLLLTLAGDVTQGVARRDRRDTGQPPVAPGRRREPHGP
ncbi:hypothetical protein ACFV7R_29975 [Streptomyces sp. NPDC059866]|uniref:hypothetical protein n=1 Tax=Streptomyces sp. NPDC059866 TaxID=3346978 RepID=UPI0036589BFB